MGDCYHCSQGNAYVGDNTSMKMSNSYINETPNDSGAGINYAMENREGISGAYINNSPYHQAKPGEEDDKKPEGGLESQLKNEEKKTESSAPEAKLTDGGKSAGVSIVSGGNYNSWNFQASFSIEPKEHELKAANQVTAPEIKKTAEDLKLEELIKSTAITGYA